MRAILSIFAVLVGCSVQVKGIPDQTNSQFGPDFAGAAAFCDSRYGTKSPAAEACFEDYRDYLKVRVYLDLSELQDYCNKAYQNPDDRAGCVNDLTALLTKAATH